MQLDYIHHLLILLIYILIFQFSNAFSSDISNVIGIGHIVPSGKCILFTTPLYCDDVIKPCYGLKPPFNINSISHVWRRFNDNSNAESLASTNCWYSGVPLTYKRFTNSPSFVPCVDNENNRRWINPFYINMIQWSNILFISPCFCAIGGIWDDWDDLSLFPWDCVVVFVGSDVVVISTSLNDGDKFDIFDVDVVVDVVIISTPLNDGQPCPIPPFPLPLPFPVFCDSNYWWIL